MKKKKNVFMYSGQGSQYYGMGEDLYKRNRTFRNNMDELDSVAKNMIGESVLQHLYQKGKKASAFKRTIFSHPSIFMLEYSLTSVLLEAGFQPDYVLGSSLGEYTALAVAGCVSPKNMLEIVIKQAQLLEANCEKGSMMAVLWEPKKFDMPMFSNISELAAVNFDSHFVISGREENLDGIVGALREQKVIYQKLPVSFAYHSSLIQNIENDFKESVSRTSFLKSEIKIISSAYGRQLEEEITCNYLWDVVREPIYTQKTINYLEHIGDYVYFDLGPSGTMDNFVKYNLDKTAVSKSYGIITQMTNDEERLDRVINEFHTVCYGEEKKMNAYVFPGQGSQYRGMGKELFEEYPDYVKKADDILGYSIKELCTKDPDNKLGMTAFTQPALYVVNALSYLKKVEETGCRSDYVAGHSLGEYNALFASGAIDFETGLKLVMKRGALMGQVTGGSMAAVIGFDDQKIREVLSDNSLESIDVANFNTPSQIVISGTVEDIKRAQPVFEEAGALRYAILNVSGAFHSRYMKEASKEFEEYLKTFQIKEPKIPVISNFYARPYRKNELYHTLLCQITGSVKWTESIRYLMGKDVTDIVQVGPGNVLDGLVRSIKREAQPLIVEEEEAVQEEEVQVQEEVIEEEVVQDYHITEGPYAAQNLGAQEFRKRYNLQYAYLAGGMCRGISSEELVIRMGNAGMMGFYGTCDQPDGEIKNAVHRIKGRVGNGKSFGLNFVCNPNDMEEEVKKFALFLELGVRNIEVSSYLSITAPLVKYRLKGIRKNSEGAIYSENNCIAKVSRPEIAEAFLSPPPKRIVDKLRELDEITDKEAEYARYIPMASDICALGSCGGQTNQSSVYDLIPSLLELRDKAMEHHGYADKICVGASGGIGTPQSAGTAFILGAEFIITGSINQCTVEANTSEIVKDMLQVMNIQDTETAPAKDLFDMGVRVQVLKKGVFFPARANKLFDLYRLHNSIEEIEEGVREQLQNKYFKKRFERVYEEIKETGSPSEIKKAEENPRYRMELIFKWYLDQGIRSAIEGNQKNKVDYQVYCGPSLGRFNQWLAGTEIENWRKRRVADLGTRVMCGAADFLNSKFVS